MTELTPRSRVLSELDQLRARVKDLVTSNMYSAASEKLDLAEFCLEGPPLARRAAAVDATCAEIAAEAERRKTALDLEWQRLKEARWDQNKVQQLTLTDFTGFFSVLSYPVRKFVPSERISAQVKFWGVAHNVSSIPFEYQSEALMSSTSLVTPRLRRMQTYLVADLTENLRLKFNSIFSDSAKKRAQFADQISVHQDRLKKISSELKDESVLNLGRANISLPISALEVEESELTAPLVYSEAELRDLEQNRQRETARRTKFEGSEMMRALQEMMGGKMKSKRELSPLETEIPREPFFDDLSRPWTEEEKKFFADYEKKCKDLDLVREKYKSELRIEVTKISEEISKIMNLWKSELEGLAATRAGFDREILGLELYAVKLHMMQITRKSQVGELRNFQENLQIANAETAEIQNLLDERSDALRAAQEELESMFKQEKSEILAAKSFLQKAGLPASVVGPLMKAFKSQQEISDRPREVEDSAVWEDFLRFKFERAELVAAIAEKQEISDQTQAEIRTLQGKLAGSQAVERKISGQISDLQRTLDFNEFNLPVLLHLTSGQNEVPFGAVVTDYSDALLLDVAKAVLPRNQRIRELAELKQEVLNEISAFNKKLKAKEFDLEKLNLRIEDLRETTKDVHLAKVTRDLKTLITEDPKGKSDKQVAVLTEVKTHVAQAGGEKLRQLERFLEQVQKNIAKKEHENELIIDRIRALQTTANTSSLSMSAESGASASLDAKTKFKGERKPVIGGGGKVDEDPDEIKEAQKAFRTVKTKAELLNLVHKHNAEIERLRKALDKFRQRTFPSFASNKELGFRRAAADIR